MDEDRVVQQYRGHRIDRMIIRPAFGGQHEEYVISGSEGEHGEGAPSRDSRRCLRDCISLTLRQREFIIVHRLALSVQTHKFSFGIGCWGQL